MCGAVFGQVAERLNAAVSKTVIHANVSGVRISPCPWQEVSFRVRVSGGSGSRKPLLLAGGPSLELDRCPSGLRSTTGTRVGVTASWVRIPPCPYRKQNVQREQRNFFCSLFIFRILNNFGRAKRGASGALYLQSALAEPNSPAPAHVCGAARGTER